MIDRDLVTKALAEDLQGGSDITSLATISESATSTADFVARKPGVVAGIDMAIEVLHQVKLSEISVVAKDGDFIQAGSTLLTVSGSTRAILQAERTALNFLGHLSGIATLAHQWVEAVAGTHCIIRDTRKTTPGYRELEKYAVRMGGASNHRMSLSDAALIKDNHIAAAGSITKAILAAKKAEFDAVKFQKRTNKPKSVGNYGINDDDDDYSDLIDLQVGYRRPKIVDHDDVELSEYVKHRLSQARKRAMALYRIKQLLV